MTYQRTQTNISRIPIVKSRHKQLSIYSPQLTVETFLMGDRDCDFYYYLTSRDVDSNFVTLTQRIYSS